MNLRVKYISFLLLAGMTCTEFAQAQSNSEIVMTPAELESFLANIANKKREQMTKRKQELQINQQMNESFRTENVQSNTDDRLYREFDRINNRIDMLMMNSGGNMRTMSGMAPAQQPSTIMYQPQQQPLMYPNNLQYPNNFMQDPYRSGTTTIIRDGQAAAPVTAPASPIQNDETRRLQGQINALNEEVRVLTQLGNATRSTDYDQEIIALNARIQELQQEVAAKNTGTTIERTIVERPADDALTNSLKGYSQKFFFANNSTTLSAADMATLTQIADIVKQNDPRLTVIIRGFASKRGSAQYNNTLSFKRAEAVKKVLMSKGLNAKHMLTMHHGIDESNSEEQARRVEITFMVH